MLKESKVGKIRFFKQDFEFSEDIENSFEQIEDFETMIDEANFHPSK